MRLFATSVLIATFLGGIALADSPSSPQTKLSPHHTPKLADAKEQPKLDLRGTDDQPAVVKILPTEKPNTVVDREEKEKREREKIDRWTLIWLGMTAGATCALFLVTGGLWIATYRMWSATKRGADIAERALTDLETPFLYPSLIKEGITNSSFSKFELYNHSTSSAGTVRPNISFNIRNYGRSPAILRSVKVSMDCWDVMEKNPKPRRQSGSAIDPIVEPGQQTVGEFKTSIGTPIDKAAYSRIKMGNDKIFLYGEIEFGDVSGAAYIQTFCLVWDYDSKRFISWESRFNERRRS